LNSDSRFSGTAGLNDFGQVVLNSANRAILFTPSVANRATRSFTTIPGLTATDGSASNLRLANCHQQRHRAGCEPILRRRFVPGALLPLDCHFAARSDGHRFGDCGSRVSPPYSQ